MLERIYSYLSYLAIPFIRLYLLKRVRDGKEDASRLRERFGFSPHTFEKGKKHIWLHGASVGESLSLLPLINHLSTLYPNVNFVVTSGTLASYNVLRTKLPPNTVHQYVPLDIKPWVMRFLKKVNPSLVIVTESEVWPNMIFSCRERNIPIYLINARLGEESAKDWGKFPEFARQVYSGFSGIFAQSVEHQQRFYRFTDKPVVVMPNLKFAAPPLHVDTEDFEKLHHTLSMRKIFIGASTHQGEEDILIRAYIRLKKDIPNLLLILAPRHMHRVNTIMNLLHSSELSFSQRSSGHIPHDNTDVFLFDTMGELGLGYALSDVAIVCGSFVPHIGGHNPIEPAQLGKCTFHGPYMENPKDILEHLEGSLIQVNEDNIDGALAFYLSHPKNAAEVGDMALQGVLAKKDSLKEFVRFSEKHLGPIQHPSEISHENTRLLV
jgi:3-deoxy-D-manno-octulosonic-acid transferase